MVHAGYVNNGQKEILHSLSGIPQGSVISPLLSNIYLHEFDIFMENIKKEYMQLGRDGSKTTGAYNSAHSEVVKARKRVKTLLQNDIIQKASKGNISPNEELRKAKHYLRKCITVMRETPSKEKFLTRIYYLRYADD